MSSRVNWFKVFVGIVVAVSVVNLIALGVVFLSGEERETRIDIVERTLTEGQAARIESACRLTSIYGEAIIGLQTRVELLERQSGVVVEDGRRIEINKVKPCLPNNRPRVEREPLQDGESSGGSPSNPFLPRDDKSGGTSSEPSPTPEGNGDGGKKSKPKEPKEEENTGGSTNDDSSTAQSEICVTLTVLGTCANLDV